MDIRKLQRAIVDGLEDVKAQGIQVFDTEHLSPLFERVIIASGTSNRQTKALAASVRDAVKSKGFPVMRTEGEDNGEWIIVDCGAAVVHVMQPAIREYYHLEEIWGDKPVKLKLEATTTRLVKASEDVSEAPKKTAAKKAPAKKATTKATPSRKTATASSSADKAPARKSAAKTPAAKTVARKSAAAPASQTAAAKKAPAKRAAPEKAAVTRVVGVKKAASKSSGTGRAPAKTASRTTTARAPAKTAAAKRPAAKKAPARKSTGRA